MNKYMQSSVHIIRRKHEEINNKYDDQHVI